MCIRDSSTSTGLREAKKIYGQKLFVVYAPWDSIIFINSFLNKFRPKALILFETEIWPSMIHACWKNKIPVILSNARLSESSYKKYNLVKLFINKTLKPAERNDNSKAVAFNPTTQLFTNEKRDIAFKTYDEADTWNRAIGVNNTKYYQDKASPEQVGALAYRLEKSRQMNGGDGRYDKPKAKPFIKKTKLILF